MNTYNTLFGNFIVITKIQNLLQHTIWQIQQLHFYRVFSSFFQFDNAVKNYNIQISSSVYWINLFGSHTVDEHVKREPTTKSILPFVFIRIDSSRYRRDKQKKCTMSNQLQCIRRNSFKCRLSVKNVHRKSFLFCLLFAVKVFIQQIKSDG